MAGRMQSLLSSTPMLTCTKTVLMVFNFIFWITGIAILALGIWTKVELYIYMELSSIYYKEAPYVLIGIGAIIVLVGSLGCCCTVKGNAILLYMYSGFLVLVFIVELSAGAAGFVYKGKLEEGFQTGLHNALDQYGTKIEISKAVDGLQEGLKCCGKNSYIDWFQTKWALKQNSTNSVPKSCCRGDQNTCKHIDIPSEPAQNMSIYTDGCYSLVTGFMKGNMGLIGGVALGVSFFQLLGAVLACCLAKNINKAKYEQVQ
ncbi:hypothetical protein ACJMK2_017687 [Sinanodonta woodiana]|uniref:Tetraspanin n=1 Tax=Sinanodonta woodiana TaxID=1069815 RepID=A0ABD3UD52_SINWO